MTDTPSADTVTIIIRIEFHDEQPADIVFEISNKGNAVRDPDQLCDALLRTIKDHYQLESR